MSNKNSSDTNLAALPLGLETSDHSRCNAPPCQQLFTFGGRLVRKAQLEFKQKVKKSKDSLPSQVSCQPVGNICKPLKCPSSWFPKEHLAAEGWVPDSCKVHQVGCEGRARAGQKQHSSKQIARKIEPPRLLEGVRNRKSSRPPHFKPNACGKATCRKGKRAKGHVSDKDCVTRSVSGSCSAVPA